MSIPGIALHDGTTIPQLGLGTYQIPDGEVGSVVEQALEIGYRHIDTAQMYGNEAGIGRALAGSGIAREDLYVTTKLNNDNHRPDDVRRSLAESLERLGLDRVDLFLIHWPLPTRYDGDFVSTWRAMVDVAAEGLTTSVGVSNFQPAHLERIIAETGVVPVVNQVEVHPFFANESVREANRSHGIVTEAWAPIARGRVGEDDTIGEIASLHRRSPSQVALRWHLQRGDVVFPKSTRTERLRSNFDIFDFELPESHIRALDSLGRGPGGRTGPDPDVFDWIP